MRTVYDDHDNDTQRKYFKQTSYLEPSAQVIPFISGKKKSQINKKKKNLFIDSYSNFQIFSTKYYNWNVKTNWYLWQLVYLASCLKQAYILANLVFIKTISKLSLFFTLKWVEVETGWIKDIVANSRMRLGDRVVYIFQFRIEYFKETMLFVVGKKYSRRLGLSGVLLDLLHLSQ